MQIIVKQRLQSELADSVIWTILARIPRSMYPPRYVQTCPTCFDCCWAAAAPCMRPSHIGAGEHFEGVVRQVPGSSDTTWCWVAQTYFSLLSILHKKCLQTPEYTHIWFPCYTPPQVGTSTHSWKTTVLAPSSKSATSSALYCSPTLRMRRGPNTDICMASDIWRIPW
jgi:hypothetical protein